jgi:hypothetical protein
MATGDEARAVGQGWEDQEHGGDISSLIADQGISDCGLVLA